ncbi:MAG: serine--tRNA ligase [Candidatus Kapaibacterium sp.]
MLDVKFIRENLELVRENIRNRGVGNADPDRVVTLNTQRVELIQQTEALRKERNENAQKMKGQMSPEERSGLIERGKELKEELASYEEKLSQAEEELNHALKNIPNMTHPDVPVGGEDDAKELELVGTPRSFEFQPKDHLTIGKELDLIDFESAADVTGSSFYYLKNEAALLELALVNYAMNVITSRGYIPHLTPDLARPAILEAIGFNPRGEESQVYNVEGHDLCLIGTAEITLGGMLSGKILRKEDLPMRVGGFSHCFRTEAGAHGRESRGLYRVHQFSKVEMFAFTTPEQSEEVHAEMLSIEKEIYSGLEIPFRVVDIATGDLGAPAYRKFDIEAWMPSRETYGEVTSTSNCTEFQSRRLNIRYRDDENQPRFVHTLNGTAVAVPRAIIAILENHQNADGSVRIPEALRPYMGGREIIEARRGA